MYLMRDTKPVINLLEGHPRQQQQVLEDNLEILKFVDGLGCGPVGTAGTGRQP